MSLLSFLSIARSALWTHRVAMEVTAHNIANAQTPGYSRQRAELAAETPLWTAFGPLGRGVTAEGVTRARDLFFDAAWREGAGRFGAAAGQRDLLVPIEAAVGGPSDAGVGAALSDLFDAFSDLAGDPTARATREQVRTVAQRLADRLHRLDAQLRETEAAALERLTADVDEVNRIAQDVARLNVDIVAARGGGAGAPDLEDRRDALVDRLAGLVGVRATVQADGTMTVIAGDAVLVERGTAGALEARALPGAHVVVLAGSNVAVDPRGGRLGGTLDTLNRVLPQLRVRLDGLAEAVVGEVNAIHRNGTTLGGATGVDFFDPAGITAGSIALSADVLASPDAIAASATGAPGDNGVALRLAALVRSPVVGLGGITLGEAWTRFATGLGDTVADATTRAEGEDATLAHLDAQRLAVSGVSVEEEMTRLIQQQQAYSAAARLVRVAEEMMDALFAAF